MNKLINLFRKLKTTNIKEVKEPTESDESRQSKLIYSKIMKLFKTCPPHEWVVCDNLVVNDDLVVYRHEKTDLILGLKSDLWDFRNYILPNRTLFPIFSEEDEGGLSRDDCWALASFFFNRREVALFENARKDYKLTVNQFLNS